MNGRVAGLPVKTVHIAGSGGIGGATVWNGVKAVARLFLDVSMVIAPAAAPILIALRLLTLPFLREFSFFSS